MLISRQKPNVGIHRAKPTKLFLPSRYFFSFFFFFSLSETRSGPGSRADGASLSTLVRSFQLPFFRKLFSPRVLDSSPALFHFTGRFLDRRVPIPLKDFFSPRFYFILSPSLSIFLPFLRSEDKRSAFQACIERIRASAATLLILPWPAV